MKFLTKLGGGQPYSLTQCYLKLLKSSLCLLVYILMVVDLAPLQRCINGALAGITCARLGRLAQLDKAWF